jgi:peptide/nickel transport system substrate-binding protein
MKMKKLTILSIAALVVALAAVPSPAAKKDTLTVGLNAKFHTLDQYQINQRVNIQIGYMLYDTLVTRDPDTGRILPGVARSWKNIDPVTWEFKLQPGVKFHNGNPLNAESVRFTVEERILADEQKSPQVGNFKWIKKVEVVDDLTFRIISHKPYPLVLERLNVLWVYDPAYCKEVGDKKLAEAPMGSGPYSFVKWDRGSQLVLKKNPNYWQEGIPKIDNVVVRIIPETSTRLAELISGGIDFAFNLIPDMWGTLTKMKNIVPMDVPILRINFWMFDSMGRASKGPWNDARVRRAIIHAIDRKAIIKEIMQGHASEVSGPCSPLHWGYDPVVKELDYDYDPEKAKALLKEAGYEKGFEMNVWQYRPYQNQPNQAAMGFLEDVGIKVTLKDYIGNIGVFAKLRNTGKISGVCNMTWGSYNIFDADAILANFFLLNEVQNYAGDKELSDWLQAARESVDPKVRKELYTKAQKRIVEEAYWMPFFIVHQIYGRDKNLSLHVGRDEVPRFNEAFWK